MVAQVLNNFEIRAQHKDGMLTPTRAATSSYVMVASISDGEGFEIDCKARTNKIKLVQRGTC
jgi:hypothetical protein